MKTRSEMLRSFNHDADIRSQLLETVATRNYKGFKIQDINDKITNIDIVDTMLYFVQEEIFRFRSLNIDALVEIVDEVASDWDDFVRGQYELADDLIHRVHNLYTTYCI